MPEQPELTPPDFSEEDIKELEKLAQGEQDKLREAKEKAEAKERLRGLKEEARKEAEWLRNATPEERKKYLKKYIKDE